MSSALARRFPSSFVRRAARAAADWVDLAWTCVTEDLRAVAPRTRGRLLDVGCGDKPYEAMFRPFVTEYVGIEHKETFDRTMASARSNGPDLYYEGSRLPFDDGSFDSVISVQVLEHTPDPAALMAEMARVLKPGGVMIVSVPFAFRLHEEPHDYFRFTPHGLAVMAERCGLRADDIAPYGGLWSVLAHKLNSYLAFRVAGLDALGQALGKLNHENERHTRARIWSLPFVVPSMLGASTAARVFDAVFPDRTEALGFRLLATKR